jgi:hypothetical protein
MTLELCASTRDWIAHSASRREFLDLADWLEAERYTAFVCDQHLRRLAFVVPRLDPTDTFMPILAPNSSAPSGRSALHALACFGLRLHGGRTLDI